MSFGEGPPLPNQSTRRAAVDRAAAPASELVTPARARATSIAVARRRPPLGAERVAVWARLLAPPCRHDAAVSAEASSGGVAHFHLAC